MGYFREIPIRTKGHQGVLYLTDDLTLAKALRSEGKAVLPVRTAENRTDDFCGFSYAVEEPEQLPERYLCRMYERLKGLPWEIVRTKRCIVREMIPEDAAAFFRLYEDASVARFMKDLRDTVEAQEAYIEDYQKSMYGFYEFGVWTILEKESGEVIGKAGFSLREGFDEPELGYLIGEKWQGRGLAKEVCEAILAYGFDEPGFDRVQILTEEENTASVALAKSLGATETLPVTVGAQKLRRFVMDAPSTARTQIMGRNEDKNENDDCKNRQNLG